MPLTKLCSHCLATGHLRRSVYTINCETIKVHCKLFTSSITLILLSESKNMARGISKRALATLVIMCDRTLLNIPRSWLSMVFYLIRLEPLCMFCVCWNALPHSNYLPPPPPTHTHTHTQLSRAIEEGFITHEGSVDSLLVISEDPADLVEKLCSKWRDSRKPSEKQS